MNINCCLFCLFVDCDKIVDGNIRESNYESSDGTCTVSNGFYVWQFDDQPVRPHDDTYGCVVTSVESPFSMGNGYVRYDVLSASPPPPAP